MQRPDATLASILVLRPLGAVPEDVLEILQTRRGYVSLPSKDQRCCELTKILWLREMLELLFVNGLLAKKGGGKGGLKELQNEVDEQIVSAQSGERPVGEMVWLDCCKYIG